MKIPCVVRRSKDLQFNVNGYIVAFVEGDSEGYEEWSSSRDGNECSSSQLSWRYKAVVVYRDFDQGSIQVHDISDVRAHPSFFAK